MDRFCGDKAKGLRVYCHPREYQGLPNRFIETGVTVRSKMYPNALAF